MNKPNEKKNGKSAVALDTVDFTFCISPLPMWIVEKSTFRILHANKAAEATYGFTEDEFRNKTFYELSVKPPSRSTSSGKESSQNSNLRFARHRKKNGQTIHVQLQQQSFKFYNQQAELIIAIDKTDEFKKETETQKRQELLAATLDVKQELLNSEDWLKVLNKIFKVAGTTLDVDRVYYFENHENNGQAYTSQRIEWSNVSATPQIDNPELQNIPLSEYGFIMEPLKKGNSFKAIISELPENPIKDLLQSQEILSVLILPVFNGEKLHGFIGFDHCRKEHAWDRLEEDFLKNLQVNLEQALEKRQMLDQLNASEKRFKALVQEGSDLLAIIDPEGNYKYVSASSEKVLGVKPEEYLGRNALEFIHPDDRDYALKQLEKIASEKYIHLEPFRFKNSDNEWRWIETKLTNMVSDPNIGGVVANSRDITELKLQQDELLLADKRHKLVSEASQDHIFDVDLQSGKVNRSGHSLEKLFGHNSEKAEVRNIKFWKKHVHPDDRKQAYDSLQKALDNPEVEKCIQQYRFRKANGQYATILDSGYIIRNEQKEAVRLVGAVRDISEIVRKKEEEKLLLEVSGTFGEPITLEKTLQKVIYQILSFTGLTIGEIWLTSIDSSQLNLIAQETTCKEGKRFFDESGEITTVKKGEGLPGEVWKQNRQVKWSNLGTKNRFLRNKSADIHRIKSGLGIPIIHQGKFLGTFIFFCKEGNGAFEQVSELLQSVSNKIGALLKHKMAKEQLRNFVSISPDFVAIIGIDGKFHKANETFVNLLGFSEEEILSNPVRNFLHPDKKSEALEQIMQISEEKSEGSIPLKLITKNGDTVWTVFFYSYNEKDKLIYTVGKDITDQKEVEIDLREANEKLNQAQKIGKLGYWKADLRSHEPHWWSLESYHIFGYKPEEFIPHFENVVQAFHPDDRHLLFQDPNEIPLDTEIEFENRIITKKGEIRWVSQHMKVIRDEENNPVSLEGTFQDITERKEFEEQLKQSNERFELAMMATHEIIWDWNHQTGEITRGLGHEKELGYKSHEQGTAQSSWFKMIHPEDRDEVWHSINDFLNKSSENVWYSEYRLMKPSGKIAYFVDRCYIIRDEKGRPLRSVGSAMDVTANREYLKKIESQNMALKEIAWKQSHEVRAPLARIMGLVQVMSLNLENSDKLKEIMDHTTASAKELDSVIREICQKTNEVEDNLI